MTSDAGKKDKMGIHYEAIVIGVSFGGLAALKYILSCLPDDFALPIVIVQHRSADSDEALIFSLKEKCRLNIKEADEKQEIITGSVYIAPANYHLLIEKDRTFSLSVSQPVNYARPSIDVLFETAAEAYGPNLIGMVLTGANNDGSKGLKRIKQMGGLAVVQDPATAEAEIMPLAALAATEADYVLPLDKIGPFLRETGRDKSGVHGTYCEFKYEGKQGGKG